MRAKIGLAGLAAVTCIGATDPPPIANYWVDAATQSGMGAGMMGAAGGQQPDPRQMMQMLQGGGAPQRLLELRLGSRQKAAGTPAADHLPPTGLGLGPRLPLITPPLSSTRDSHTEVRPKGRFLIYWGCGERVSAGQPTVIDLAKMAAGQVPPGLAAMSRGARSATGPRPGATPGYGEWPNARHSRPIPAQGSLVGSHQVQGNYTPPIAFTLAAGQDFMPALNFREAGALPSGAVRLTWQRAPQATGYALALFSANEAGDVLMWTSAKSASMSPTMDYVAPAEVKRQIAAGGILPPTTDQCVLPAEVAKAAPQGAMVMMIGYGPELFFAEAPKAPKWTTRVRYKTTATLMRGMGDMLGGMDDAGAAQARPAEEPKRKKRRGLGDLIRDASPIPIP